MKTIILKLGTVCIDSKGNKCRRIPHNINRRMHWAEKHRWNKAWKEEVWGRMMLKRKEFGKLPYKYVKLSIILRQVSEMDYDNLYSSAKIIIDALKVKNGCGVITDDSPKYLELSLKQVKVKHKKDEHVELRILPVG